jgi:hypothetical protein
MFDVEVQEPELEVYEQDKHLVFANSMRNLFSYLAESA